MVILLLTSPYPIAQNIEVIKRDLFWKFGNLKLDFIDSCNKYAYFSAPQIDFSRFLNDDMIITEWGTVEIFVEDNEELNANRTQRQNNQTNNGRVLKELNNIQHNQY